MISVLSTEPVTVRVVCQTDEWDSIREHWDQLHAASSTASTSLDFVWLRRWWQVYGPEYGAGGLRIITVWRGQQLVGALPLYMDFEGSSPFPARCLRFISTGETEHEETCPEYLNALYRPDEAAECIRAIWDAIHGMTWDRLEFLDMPADSLLLRWPATFSHARRMRLLPRGSCPIADIGEGFEAYFRKLSAHNRKHVRKDVRTVERLEISFELADPASVDSQFDELIRLHQKRWNGAGMPGCFSSEKFTEFHRSLVGEWAGIGRIVLARLAWQGVTLAILYGFITGNTFDLYQMAVDLTVDSGISSPGVIANILLMKKLTERGVTRYDFLRGASRFKNSITTEQRHLVSLVCMRPSVRSWLALTGRLLTRAHRKMNGLVSRR